MTETADTTDTTAERAFFDPDIRTPEMEMAERGEGVPSAADLDLAEINPANPHLFKEDRWQDHFARLRAEDVHARDRPDHLAGAFARLGLDRAVAAPAARIAPSRRSSVGRAAVL